jgi:hypothetical protein
MIDGPIKMVIAESMVVPPSRSFNDFLAEREFGILSTSYPHVFGAWIGPNRWRLGFETIPVAQEFWHPPMPIKQQRDMFNGFSRALAKGPALMVIKSSDWFNQSLTGLISGGSTSTQWTLQQWFLPQGMGLLAFDFQEFEATIIGPCSLLPVMMNIEKWAPKGAVRLDYNDSYVCGNAEHGLIFRNTYIPPHNEL